MRVLVIDNDATGASVLKRFLEEEAFTVDVAREGVEGSYMARTHPYDVVLLDSTIPDRSAVRICVEIRASGSSVVIIGFVKGKEADSRVELLIAGADDCLVKPYSYKELLARMRAIFRRGPSVKSDVLSVGNIVLDSRTQVVRSGKKMLSLSRMEFSLLELLLRNKGCILSKSIILEHVWGLDATRSSNTVAAHICSLRQRLGRRGKEYIRNIPGRGYIAEE